MTGRYVESRRTAWKQRRAGLIDRRPEPLICHGCDWNVISGVTREEAPAQAQKLPAWMVLRARMIDRCAIAGHIVL